MGAVERRVSRWVDLVGDLVTGHATAFPHRVVSAQLHDTFGSQVSWNWMDPAGRAGFELYQPIEGWPTAELRDTLADALLHHPIMRWYLLTGDLRPMSAGRVPRSMVTRRGRQVVREHLVPIGMEQQLVVAYRWRAGGEHRAFVLAQGREDFSEEDLAVALALQPLLCLLDRQVGASGVAPTRGGTDLTGRELAVLRLLAGGLTAAAIGRRLSISERTVHRHLQGVYRKLGSHDRLTAVLAARDAGLLPEVSA
ncbi:MAG: helix-turn-helix transcriptional regulator [Nocardioides sp.]